MGIDGDPFDSDEKNEVDGGGRKNFDNKDEEEEDEFSSPTSFDNIYNRLLIKSWRRNQVKS